LSREIRDLVYYEVCGELKRESLRWEDTAPWTKNIPNEGRYQHTAIETVLQYDEDGNMHMPVVKPTAFHNCTIMRTSRQVHAEFAEVLYSSPLQLIGVCAGINIIPLSSIYAGLVRSILVVRTSLDDGESYQEWLEQLQIATSLPKVFPDVSTLRLGWYHTGAPNDPVNRIRLDPTAWDAIVHAVQKTIRLVEKGANTPLNIPDSLEVVQLRGTMSERLSWPNQYVEVVSFRTPVTEAIEKLRLKLPKKAKAKQRVVASV
jgi:hypothetical protein